VIGPTGEVRGLVATKPVNFRKGMDGVAVLVKEAAEQ
jgi:transposase